MPTIPVILLSGFLGSGKTTLLNEMLQCPEFDETALLINEFGEIGLDQDLVPKKDDALLIASSGCICCEARSELTESLNDLICGMLTEEIGVPKRLIIETTGLADPAPVIAELLRIGEKPLFQNRTLGMISFSLHSVVTLVSAVTGDIDIDNHLEAFKQVTLADTVLITKTDLISDPASRINLVRLKERLVALNPSCRLLDKHENFQPKVLLEGASYDIAQLGEDGLAWLQAEAFNDAAHVDHAHDPNRHDDRVHSLNFEFDEQVTRRALDVFLKRVSRDLGGHLLRMKGIIGLEDDEARPAIIHAVRWHQTSLASLDGWPKGERRSRLVLIVQDDVDETARRLVSDLKSGIVRSETMRWSTVIATVTGMTMAAAFIAFLLYTITSRLTGIT